MKEVATEFGGYRALPTAAIGKANIAKYNTKSITGLTPSNSSGNLMLTKTGAFTAYEISPPSGVCLSYLHFGYNDSAPGEWMGLAPVILNSNQNSITVSHPYNAGITDPIIYGYYYGDTGLGGYTIPTGAAGTYKKYRVDISLNGLAFDVDSSWFLGLLVNNSVIKLATAREQIAKAGNGLRSATANSGYNISLDVTVPLYPSDSGKFLFLVSSENTQGCYFTCHIFDTEYQDVDVVKINGVAPISSSNLASAVAEEMKAQRLGTDVMVEPDEA